MRTQYAPGGDSAIVRTSNFTSTELGSARWIQLDSRLSVDENICASTGFLIFHTAYQRLKDANFILRANQEMWVRSPPTKLPIFDTPANAGNLTYAWYEALKDLVNWHVSFDRETGIKSLFNTVTKPLNEWTVQERMVLTQVLIWVAFYLQGPEATSQPWAVSRIKLMPHTEPFFWGQTIELPRGMTWANVSAMIQRNEGRECWPYGTVLRTVGADPTGPFPQPVNPRTGNPIQPVRPGPSSAVRTAQPVQLQNTTDSSNWLLTAGALAGVGLAGWYFLKR